MAKFLDIIINPNPILRKKSIDIGLKDISSKPMQELLLDMELTMREKDGAGLAAPQVGHNIKLIVINQNDKTLFMFNPKITKKSWAKETEEEGCLSVLNNKGEILYAPVSRHKKISCSYIDDKGNKKTLTGEKLLARVIQHEIDHLNGILFIDYLKNFKAQPKSS